MLIELLLANVLLAQDPVAGEAERWELVDAVAFQAGDEVMTMVAFYEYFEKRRTSDDVASEEALQQAFKKAFLGAQILLLEIQAGKDLGLNAEEVDSFSRRALEDERREKGAQALAEELRAEGLDALTRAATQTDEIYEIFWRYKITGQGRAGSERPIRDRFARPSQLRAYYAVNKERLAEPPLVTFQTLAVSAANAGGSDEARALLEEVRDRALQGEDFAELVEEYGEAANAGIQEPVLLSSIADAELRDFAGTAAPGDFAAIQPTAELGPDGQPLGFRLVRLVASQAGLPAPEFDAPRVQSWLSLRYLRSQDEVRLTAARQRISRDANLWINPTCPVGRVPAEAVGTPTAPPANP
jgi:hypothetical protein